MSRVSASSLSLLLKLKVEMSTPTPEHSEKMQISFKFHDLMGLSVCCLFWAFESTSQIKIGTSIYAEASLE